MILHFYGEAHGSLHLRLFIPLTDVPAILSSLQLAMPTGGTDK